MSDIGQWVHNISHKEYVPSSILALPLIKPTVLEENSDIRKCGRWLGSQPFGIFHIAKMSATQHQTRQKIGITVQRPLKRGW